MGIVAVLCRCKWVHRTIKPAISTQSHPNIIAHCRTAAQCAMPINMTSRRLQLCLFIRLLARWLTRSAPRVLRVRLARFYASIFHAFIVHVPIVLASIPQAAMRYASVLSASTLLLVLPIMADAAVAEAAPSVAAAAPAASNNFDLFEFRVEGNSKLPDAAIEKAVFPYLGEGKSIADVENARAALETVYRDAGYLTVLVTIPEQPVDTGVVTLKVTEGEVNRLRVKGTEYHTPSGIRRMVPELAEGNVPNFPQMQKELAAVNRTPGLHVTPLLKASKVPGKVDVNLDVEDQSPVHGNIDWNNRQSANTTAQRLSASLRYDNLWQLGHSIGLAAQVSPQNSHEVRVASLTYVVPMREAGNAWAFYAVRSRSDLATISGATGLGLLSNTDIVGTRYVIPFDVTEETSQTLSVGADYKSLKRSTVVLSVANPLTPVRYMPLSAEYALNWTGTGQSLNLGVSTSIGLPGLMGARQNQFEANGSSASFFILRSNAQHTYSLGRWNLSSKADLQLASVSLVSAEQFSAGGAESVRGYLESERVGDDGVRLSFELQTPTQKLAESWSLRGLVFVEGAGLHRKPSEGFLAGTNTSQHFNLASSGVGLRITGSHGLRLEVDWARVSVAGPYSPAGSTRVLGRLVSEF